MDANVSVNNFNAAYTATIDSGYELVESLKDTVVGAVNLLNDYSLYRVQKFTGMDTSAYLQTDYFKAAQTMGFEATNRLYASVAIDAAKQRAIETYEDFKYGNTYGVTKYIWGSHSI